MMRWYELLYRKFEMKYLGKKYCDYTQRHGHDLKYLGSMGNGLLTHIHYECTVCKRKMTSDLLGIYYD